MLLETNSNLMLKQKAEAELYPLGRQEDISIHLQTEGFKQ